MALPADGLCSNQTTEMFGGFDFSNYSYPQQYEPLDFSAVELVKVRSRSRSWTGVVDWSGCGQGTD